MAIGRPIPVLTLTDENATRWARWARRPTTAAGVGRSELDSSLACAQSGRASNTPIACPGLRTETPGRPRSPRKMAGPTTHGPQRMIGARGPVSSVSQRRAETPVSLRLHRCSFHGARLAERYV